MKRPTQTEAILAVATLLLVGTLVAARLEAQEPVPVDPLTQCRAYLELVVKDRANAQTEAAYFAARARELQEANKALEAKVKALEAKPEGHAKETKK
jgi:Skp family chaperone for outer membrane proteins